MPWMRDTRNISEDAYHEQLMLGGRELVIDRFNQMTGNL